MKILIFTYSITRKAGGVFNAVCDLFTNTSNPQLSSSASFLRLNVLSSLN